MQSQRVGNQFSSFLKSGSLLSILFIMNVAVWFLSLFCPLVDYLYAFPAGSAKSHWNFFLGMSSNVLDVMLRPWTMVTYMFIHDGFWHIFFNMLVLYFAGTMCCRYLGSRRFGWIYFVGGVFGGLLYLLVYNIFPIGQLHVSTLVGASAAVLAVLVATATYIPNQEVQFWLVRSFSVKLKWVAIVFVIIDLLSIPTSNAGGHIAHIGGALFGWLFVVVMRLFNKPSGYSYSAQSTSPLGSKLRNLFSRKPKMNAKRGGASGRPLTDEEYNLRRAQDQKRVDAILDKISKSGYENLTKAEKEFLFKYK